MSQPRAGDHERLARAIGDAVLAVPGVAGLASAGPVEVATLFPGGKVTGVRLGDPVEVHVALCQVPIGPVAEQVRSAVQAALADVAGERSAARGAPTDPAGGPEAGTDGATGPEQSVVVTVAELTTSALASASRR